MQTLVAIISPTGKTPTVRFGLQRIDLSKIMQLSSSRYKNSPDKMAERFILIAMDDFRIIETSASRAYDLGIALTVSETEKNRRELLSNRTIGCRMLLRWEGHNE
jgi:hypothetical protein